MTLLYGGPAGDCRDPIPRGCGAALSVHYRDRLGGAIIDASSGVGRFAGRIDSIVGVTCDVTDITDSPSSRALMTEVRTDLRVTWPVGRSAVTVGVLATLFDGDHLFAESEFDDVFEPFDLRRGHARLALHSSAEVPLGAELRAELPEPIAPANTYTVEGEGVLGPFQCTIEVPASPRLLDMPDTVRVPRDTIIAFTVPFRYHVGPEVGSLSVVGEFKGTNGFRSGYEKPLGNLPSGTDTLSLYDDTGLSVHGPLRMVTALRHRQPGRQCADLAHRNDRDALFQGV